LIVISARAAEAALALWAKSIIGIDPGRRPGPHDWLILATGNSRLIPVQTHPVLLAERLGLVVYVDAPPNSRALVMLAQLAAGDAACLAAMNEPSDNMRWVLDTITRVAAALSPAAAVPGRE